MFNNQFAIDHRKLFWDIISKTRAFSSCGDDASEFHGQQAYMKKADIMPAFLFE